MFSVKFAVVDAANLVSNLLSALASALAFVKYKLLEPSFTPSVSPVKLDALPNTL